MVDDDRRTDAESDLLLIYMDLFIETGWDILSLPVTTDCPEEELIAE